MLWHQSGVNMKGEPFVQLILRGSIIAQMTPGEARDHARAITEAAEAAEQDAFLLTFLKDSLNLPDQASVGVLTNFRRWREARGKSSPPSDPGEFIRNPPLADSNQRKDN